MPTTPLQPQTSTLQSRPNSDNFSNPSFGGVNSIDPNRHSSIGAGSSSIPVSLPLAFFNASRSASPALSYLQTSPTPSESDFSSSYSISGPVSKQRISNMTHRFRSVQSQHNWTIDDQEDFGQYLARITTSAGFPFQWVENDEWIRFFQCFIPGAKPIKWRSLSQKYVPTETQRFCATVKN
jgi:hypothetical protein